MMMRRRRWKGKGCREDEEMISLYAAFLPSIAPQHGHCIDLPYVFYITESTEMKMLKVSACMHVCTWTGGMDELWIMDDDAWKETKAHRMG